MTKPRAIVHARLSPDMMPYFGIIFAADQRPDARLSPDEMILPSDMLDVSRDERQAPTRSRPPC